MGQQQSKGELLLQEVYHRNINGIKDLHRDGASLEWVNSEGMTPLIAASMSPELFSVAKTLIELGANVNAFRPGRQGGTPLHHAARRGLEHTVELLLLHGANPLLLNEDHLTPLQIARAKGFSKVVRMIEGHICLYAGWLRELYGPSILELFAPQFLTRKVWVVVVPCGSRNLQKPFRLELAIYDRLQDAQPRMTIALWKAKMEDPTFNQSDLAVVLSEPAGKAQIKLAPLDERDKKNFQQFCDACKGIPQVMHTAFPFNAPTAFAPATTSTSEEDVELAMALSASLQSAVEEGFPVGHAESSSGAIMSHGASSSAVLPSIISTENDHPSSSMKIHTQNDKASSSTSEAVLPLLDSATPPAPPMASAPPAPPMESAPPPPEDGRVHYPCIDFEPVGQAGEISMTVESEKKGEEQSSSCVVCLDAPVEGACVPCGHMAGCMSCLEEIKAKKWGCPICRSKITQIIRVYAV